jgi:hypothetical protein
LLRTFLGVEVVAQALGSIPSRKNIFFELTECAKCDQIQYAFEMRIFLFRTKNSQVLFLSEIVFV